MREEGRICVLARYSSPVILVVGMVVMVLLSMAVPTTRAEATCTVPNSISNGQTADATAVMDNFNALTNCVNSVVQESGSPAAGSLPVFSGTNGIETGNLSGDCSTNGTLAVTCTKTNGTPLGPFATGTDAGQLSGTVSVNRFDGGTNADSVHFLRGDGTWATPGGGTGTGGGLQTVVDFGYLKASSATESIFIPNGSNNTPSTSASDTGNLKISFTVAAAQTVIVDFFAILSRDSGLSRVSIFDTSGNLVWPKYPQAPDPGDNWTYHSKVYSRPQGEGDGQTLQFTAAIAVNPGSYTWVIRADHALSFGTATWYDRMFRVQYR